MQIINDFFNHLMILSKDYQLFISCYFFWELKFHNEMLKEHMCKERIIYPLKNPEQ